MFKGFLRTDGKPQGWEKVVLPLLPFAVLIGMYLAAYSVRHAHNPQDKLVPSPIAIGKAIWHSATVPLIGEKIPPLWQDTYHSGKMIVLSVALLFPIALLGLNMGLLPYAETIWGKFIIAFGLIAPVAIAPVVMAFLGLDLTMKLTLVLCGAAPVVIRGTYLAAKAVPENLIHLAQTRRASEFEIVYSIVWPLILPDVLNVIRQTIVPTVSLILYADSLVTKQQAGFMYRMVVAGRRTGMDEIIGIALWIVLGTFLLDLAFRLWINRYPWARAS